MNLALNFKDKYLFIAEVALIGAILAFAYLAFADVTGVLLPWQKSLLPMFPYRN